MMTLYNIYPRVATRLLAVLLATQCTCSCSKHEHSTQTHKDGDGICLQYSPAPAKAHSEAQPAGESLIFSIRAGNCSFTFCMGLPAIARHEKP